MADIDRIPSELTVGVFSDNLLNTQIDTQERIDSLYSDFNVPAIQHSVIPKEYSGDDILKSTELPNIDDHLSSLDPKKRELGKQMLEHNLQKNRAYTQEHGLPSMVRYQKGMEKFTDEKFGFDPYKSIAENEDFYHKNVWEKYSTGGQIWRGTATFAGRTLSKLVTGLVGMVGDIGSMAWNGLQEAVEAGGGPSNNFWADVSDNWLARTMEEAHDSVKENILPTYKALNYDDKGAFSKLFDSYFWTNDLADGAGFLLQFAIPAMLFGKAAQLGKVGKLGRFGKVMAAGVGENVTASRLTKGIGSSLEFLTGSRNVGGISAHVFNTTMESVAETKEGFNSTVKDLLSKGYNKEEAERIASEYAPHQFGLNMAILSASNAFENKWFQRSIGNRLNPGRQSINKAGEGVVRPGTWVGKFFANNKWGNRIFTYGGAGAKASFMEGYWEENAQLAAARASVGSYMRKGEDTSSVGKLEKSVGFWKQLMKQTYDAANDKDREAADSIMAGAVIGILGGTAFSRFSGSRNIPQNDENNLPIYDKDGRRVTKKSFLPEGARKQRNRENAETIAQIKNAKDAWLSINVMPEDMYDPDGKINDEKAKARVLEVNAKLDKIASVFKRSISLDQLTDPQEREAKQLITFADFVKAHIFNGSADALVNRIKNWGNKTKEELEMYGVTEEVAKDHMKWANVAQNLIDEYKKIDQIKYVNPRDKETGKQQTISQYLSKQRAVKAHIFDYIAQKQAALMTAATYAEKKAEVTPFTDVNEFGSYNELISKKLYFESILSATLEDDVREFYQGRLDKVQSQLDMRKNSLPEHDKGIESDMVFEKGSDVKQQEEDIYKSLEDYFTYAFGEEDFTQLAKANDELIKKFSDPETGIETYDQHVDYWNEKWQRTLDTKLDNMGYTKAEITTMTTDEKVKLIDEGKSKPKPPEEEKKEEEKKEPELSERQKAKEAAIEVLNDLYDDPVPEGLTDIQLGKVVVKTILTIKDDDTMSDERIILQKFLSFVSAELRAEAAPTAKTESKPEEVRTEEVKKEDEKEEVKKEEDPLAAQIADIEKRRQEELKKMDDSPSYRRAVLDDKDYEEKVDDLLFRMYGETSISNDSKRIVNEELFKKLDNELQKLHTKSDIDAKNKVNAKYDAELAALKPKVESVIEQKYPVGYRFRIFNNTTKNDEDYTITNFDSARRTYMITDGNYELFVGEDYISKGKPLDNSAVLQPNTSLVDQVQGTERTEPIITQTEPTIKESTVTLVTGTLLDQIRTTYTVYKDALENERTVTEESAQQGMKIENNRINIHYDGGKAHGEIAIATSSPKDLGQKGIVTDNNNLARFNFLENLTTFDRLDKEDFKLVIGVGKKGGLYGLVADKNGVVQLIGEDGMPSSTGQPLLFLLDYDLYSPKYINTPRKELVKPPFETLPMVTRINPVTGLTDKEGNIFLMPSFHLHPSFEGQNVLEVIEEMTKKKTVTASINFITQGVLYREGATNSFDKIPKGTASHTAHSLMERGHVEDIKGRIVLKDEIVNNTYIRAHRITFPLYRDLTNPMKGSENVEFRPLKIGEIVNESGQKIHTLLKTGDGKNIFEEALKGNLPSKGMEVEILRTILRPDKFMILDLGNSTLVVNLKKFKKFLNSSEVNATTLRSLTTMKDILESEMNIANQYYESEEEILTLPEEMVGTGIGNYAKFINRNVVTSAEPITKGDVQGYARVNKRLGITIDTTADDMIKYVSQTKQAEKTQTTVDVENEDISTVNKEDYINEGGEIDPDDITDINCKK